jgi:hypothetical protein
LIGVLATIGTGPVFRSNVTVTARTLQYFIPVSALVKIDKLDEKISGF